MKKISLYIAAFALAAGMSSCDDDFSRPPVVLPETLKVEPTMTTEAFKTQFWGTVQTGPTEVGFTEKGDSIILTGRVCSSDESGNIYKNVVIQTIDANGEQIALSFSVNRNDIFEIFPFGQEVAVRATGLNIGPYRKLLQFGSVNGDQMTFMDEAVFTAHVVRNGSPLPDPAKVDTTVATLAEIVAAKSTDSELMKWQSRLVRVNDVSFEDAGQQFAGQQNTDRYVTDGKGNRLNVRNSSYSDFSDKKLPYGTGAVAGILSYYQSDWQLLLIDEAGCIGFDGVAPEPVPGTEPSGEGTAESPYNVAKAMEVLATLGADVESEEVYVSGVISAVKEISLDFGNATYSITDEGGSTTLGVFRGKWIGGEKFTSADQLAVGAKVVVKGKLINYKGNTPQLAQNNEVVSYNGEGGDKPVVGPTGDGTEASPYNVIKAMDVINGLGADVESEEVYVAGVISAVKEISTSFGNATYSITDEGGSTTLGVYRGYWLNGEKFTAEDQLKVGAKVVVKGKLINFKGNTPQFTTGNQVVSYDGEGGTAPEPGDQVKYTLVNTITSGASYVLVVDGQYGAAISSTSSFGRFNLTDASISGDSFTAPKDAAFVMTAVDGKGYTIVDHSGRYLGMDDSHFTTFQIFDTANDGCYWSAEFADGKVKISNTLNPTCFVCVSKGTEGTFYTNMAPAKEPAEYKLPQLFKAE